MPFFAVTRTNEGGAQPTTAHAWFPQEEAVIEDRGCVEFGGDVAQMRLSFESVERGPLFVTVSLHLLAGLRVSFGSCLRAISRQNCISLAAGQIFCLVISMELILLLQGFPHIVTPLEPIQNVTLPDKFPRCGG